MALTRLSPRLRQYLLVTGNYWAFTLTDGALRMLVVLYFHGLGYSPLAIASLFLFYEIFGVVTNLVGGWLGARLGLQPHHEHRPRSPGAGARHVAGAIALADGALGDGRPGALRDCQGSQQDERQELHQVAGAGGGAGSALPVGGTADRFEECPERDGLLPRWRPADPDRVSGGRAGHGTGVGTGLVHQHADPETGSGQGQEQAQVQEIFSKSRVINYLSAARLFLFGARDVWFVVALPVYLASSLGWDDGYVGSFLALWIIAYGVVQTQAPALPANARGGCPMARWPWAGRWYWP